MPLIPRSTVGRRCQRPFKAKKGKRKSNFSLLSRLFEGKGHEEGNGEEEREMMPIIAAGYDEGSSLDLGAAVLQRRPGYLGFLTSFVFV